MPRGIVWLLIMYTYEGHSTETYILSIRSMNQHPRIYQYVNVYFYQTFPIHWDVYSSICGCFIHKASYHLAIHSNMLYSNALPQVTSVIYTDLKCWWLYMTLYDKYVYYPRGCFRIVNIIFIYQALNVYCAHAETGCTNNLYWFQNIEEIVSNRKYRIRISSLKRALCSCWNRLYPIISIDWGNR